MAVGAQGREVIFEFQRLGLYVKVIAVDTKTGEEISITGAASAPQDYLQRLAYERLRRVLEKKGLWS